MRYFPANEKSIDELMVKFDEMIQKKKSWIQNSPITSSEYGKPNKKETEEKNIIKKKKYNKLS